MNRRELLMLSGLALTQTGRAAQTQQAAPGANAPGGAQGSPETFLLKDYRPTSVYKVPVTEIQKAKYPVIDVHSHTYPKTAAQIPDFVRSMDQVGIEKTVIMTQATGPRFDDFHEQYSKYFPRFEVWCGFDVTGIDKPDFGPAAVKELERCHRQGAAGVGEISDKGWGLGRRSGVHADDPRMDPLFEKCAELGMPVNIHVSDPYWGYLPMDLNNDGLMNGYTWRIDEKQPGILGHNGLIESLEKTVQRHPKTTFIACHLANLTYDLGRLGQILDRHPNLYADLSARFGEIAPTPRAAAQFIEKYSDRILYGTDQGYAPGMYRSSFRILESSDDHWYNIELYHFHWALYGLGLPDNVLRKVYRGNALKILKKT